MHKAIDPAELSDAERHKLTIGTIVPRPIAWTSTADAAGRTNLAPYSYFMGCHSYVPALALSIGSRADALHPPKDTAANILATRQFVVHIVTEALAESMNISAAAFPTGMNEAEAAGLEMLPSSKVTPQRVAAAPIAMECELMHALTLGEAPRASTLFVGRIVQWHVREDLIDQHYRIDQGAIGAIARMGGPNYINAKDPWTMTIPDWRSIAPASDFERDG